MTAVFVHGNPESDAIWGPLRSAIAANGGPETIALSPPGFGAPVPDDWDPTPANYVAWLATEIEQVGQDHGAVDIVGHDWGAGHVFGLVAEHPDLVRSYAADCAGLLNPDYVWHDAAQGWQTPDVGEEMIAAMINQPLADRFAAYEGLGITGDVASALAEATNADMGRCILGLYRGAKQPHLAKLGDRLAAADRPPGLLIDPTDDPYVPSSLVPAVAKRLGVASVSLAGQGHWWMLQDPAPAAAALVAFWSAL